MRAHDHEIILVGYMRYRICRIPTPSLAGRRYCEGTYVSAISSRRPSSILSRSALLSCAVTPQTHVKVAVNFTERDVGMEWGNEALCQLGQHRGCFSFQTGVGKSVGTRILSGLISNLPFMMSVTLTYDFLSWIYIHFLRLI